MSVKRGRQKLLIQSPAGGDKDYLAVALCKDGIAKTMLVHRLVLETFVGPCPLGMEGCHINDVGTDNCLDNLYWGTKAQNAQDGIRNGVKANGERIGNSKLKEQDVREIRRLVVEGERHKVVAKMFGVSRGTVQKIVYRSIWDVVN